jgi:alpha-glucosidase
VSHGEGRKSTWWEEAVFYQVYVRSFADASGDGLGDLEGIRRHLPYLRHLGVDGIWLTPFYPTPDADHGYDVSDYVDVDPRLGTLGDFDRLVADAHAHGLRLVVDIVPNHCSREHVWFRNALSAQDHPDRRRFVFADGRDGGPPNNWPSVFGGGPAWSLDDASGQWYLHLFAPEQPDLDWHEPTVQADFEQILRFWLDRGIDGFRIDVAWAMFKDRTLKDEPEPFPDDVVYSSDWRTVTDQPELHPLFERWREIADEYDGDRVLIGEVVFSDPARVAAYTRPHELHLAFNFTLLLQPWESTAMRSAIDATLAAQAAVGAPATWVLENHDIVRIVERYGGVDAARAAALLLLALPGPCFIYAGQELGLPEVSLPPGLRQDPVFHRSNGKRFGRDGCRIPMPWTAEGPGFGFSSGSSWLPIPDDWADLSVEAQSDDPASVLSLYRSALAHRPGGPFAWLPSPPGTLVFSRGALTCAVNVDGEPLALPKGDVLLASSPLPTGTLPARSAAWIGRP